MASDKDLRTILITGATGKQGGAVLRHLYGKKGFRLRAMTRNPFSEGAKAIAARGIDVVRADLDDESSLEEAVKGAWGVFAVQNTWEAGVVREEEQGKRLANVARENGVQHFVYTSVSSAQHNTGIPHFDNKWRVEQEVRQMRFPTWAIVRPVFFMENLTSPMMLNNDRLTSGLGAETMLQMIAADDIGRFVARLFEKAEKLSGTQTDLAGDAATMPEAAEILSGALGRKIEYVHVPIEEIRKNSEDYGLMLAWFERVGYSVNIKALAKSTGVKAMKLGDWAHRYVRSEQTHKEAV